MNHGIGTGAWRWALGASIASVCVAGPALAEEPSDAERAVLLLGVFEGHGIVEPKDEKRAREMVAWAQRAAAPCASAYLERGGGTGAQGQRCPGVRDPGPDAASAILDALNDPRTSARSPRFATNFEYLAQTLANMRRPEVVPVLIRALERLALRTRYPDGYNVTDSAYQASTRVQVIDAALEVITLTTQSLARRDSEQERVDAIVGAWRKWFEAHGSEPRAVWEQRALKEAEEQIASGREGAASDVLVIVLRDPVTRARARALLPAYRQKLGAYSSELKDALKRYR